MRNKQDNQAIPAQFMPVDHIFEELGEKAEEALQSIDKSDRDLANLPSHEGWRVFEEIVNQWIRNLKDMIDPSSGNAIIRIKDNPYDIGLRYLIVTFAISQIKAILAIPRATMQGIDEAEKNRKQRK